MNLQYYITVRKQGLLSTEKETTFTKMKNPKITTYCILLIAICTIACSRSVNEHQESTVVFKGGQIIDGKGNVINNGVLVTKNGKIESVTDSNQYEISENAEVIDITGKTIMPGLINSHGHIGDVKGLESGNYSSENILVQLRLNARYGVTTILSLGGDGSEVTDITASQQSAGLDYSRLFIAGQVVTGSTPEEAIAIVNQNASLPTDFIKIRVDDNLGSSEKMSPEIYQAVIDRAHELNLPLAAHLFYLNDAKSLLASGADFIAHSIRDRSVDNEVIALFKEKNVCYCPTLTREISTFIYESTPEFFSDPFFLKEVDPNIINTLNDPERQQKIRESRSAQLYKQALDTALLNLKLLSDSGVTIAFGTDSGPPARFQGYFEHLELELMVQAGLTPMQAIVSATGQAAECLKLNDIGTLEKGKWADFIILTNSPLENIINTRSIESVWISGNKVPEKL